ncbi:hypothetical protein [uncultured Mailhella sp.]|uniref:hypothetical protein n=1 Tax=uncultured Mailhella sp. TaxID=1981031 RepID=UPI0026025C52|nr:hypothetical protein [uncultured Mailhella sp.]
MKQKYVLSFLAFLFFISTAVVPIFAVEAVGGGVATSEGNTTFSSPSEDSSSFITSPNSLLGGSDSVITTDDVNDWVNRKGTDIIRILTDVVMAASLIGFLVGTVLVIIGALGEKRTMTGGMLAMLICCVTFAVSTCAPQIVLAISGWLKS